MPSDFGQPCSAKPFQPFAQPAGAASSLRGIMLKKMKIRYLRPGMFVETRLYGLLLESDCSHAFTSDILLAPYITEAKVLTERWRSIYNTICPHSSLGYRPPAPESFELPVKGVLGLETKPAMIN